MQSQRSDKNAAAWNKKTLEIRDPQSSAPLCPSCPPETGAWCGHGEKATNERIVKGRIDKKLSSPSDSVFFLCHFLFQTFIRTSSTQTAPLLKHPNTQDSPSPTPSNPDRSSDIAADERSLVRLHLAGTCAGSLLLHGRRRFVCRVNTPPFRISTIFKFKSRSPFSTQTRHNNSMAFKISTIAPHHRSVSDSCPLSRANHVIALGLSLRSASPGIP